MTREQLIARLWPKGVVEFDTSLNTAMRKLRQALGDDAESPRYIETLPRKGYRFIGVVHAATAEARAPATAHEAARAAVPRAVAVLPFKPLLEAQANPALQLGMADTLIAALSNFADLRVSPLSAIRGYGGMTQDPLAAGKDLQVDTVLDGSIQTDQRRIRMSARLLNVADGRCLWSQQFDNPMNDIFEVQDAIARQVVVALALALRSPLPAKRALHLDAYQAYVSGLYKWQHRLPHAVTDFETALLLDPDYPAAWSGLANALAAQAVYGYVPPREILPRAREAALRAVALDENSADAHDALGHILVQFERRFEVAEACYRRAITLRNNAGESWHRLAIACAYQERMEDAIIAMRQAVQLEPTRLSFNVGVGMILYFKREYAEAIACIGQVLLFDANFAIAHAWLGRCLLEIGDSAGALRHFERSSRTPGGEGDKGRTFARMGQRAEARGEIDRLEGRGREGYGVAYDVATIWAGLGEHPAALSALRRALDDYSQLLGFLSVDPAVDSLRCLPEFSFIEASLHRR